MTKRTYLTITPDSRPVALRAAGKLPGGENALEYDPEQKLWFAKESADLNRVSAWLPENTVTGRVETTSDLTPEEEFAGALRDAGFQLPHGTLPVMDGKRHRCLVENDKGTRDRDGSGVYQGYLDGRPAGWYQNHRASAEKTNWTASGEYKTDPARVMQQRALNAQRQWDRQQSQQATYDATVAGLVRQWTRMPPATNDHPYLVRKQVLVADGIRQDRYGNLVVPLRNLQGDIRSVEYISPDGKKTLKKDAEKKGSFFVVGGELQPGEPVLYAEGYATAASVHQACGLPVVMCVDAGNLVTVSRLLHTAYPDTPHIILGEDDFTRTDNKGLIKAREAAGQVNGTVILPAFTPEERQQTAAGTASFSDFNDIHVSRGLDAVREQLAPVLDTAAPGWRAHSPPENNMTRASDAPGAEDIPQPTGTPEPTATTEPAVTTEPQATVAPKEPPEPAVTTDPQPGATAKKAAESESAATPPEEPGPDTNGFRAAFGGNQETLPDAAPIDLDALVKGLVRERENDTWVYSLNGERAFIHHVNRGHFAMATPQASLDDRMVLGALLAAKADADAFRRGALEITGSPDFQEKVLGLIIRHNVEVKLLKPDQRDALENMRQAMNAPLDKDRDALNITPLTPGSDHAPAQAQTTSPSQPAPQNTATPASPSAPQAPEKPGATATAASPAQPVQPAPGAQEKPPREWADPRTGMLTGHGPAPYQFKKDNSDSYFVTLRTPDGEKTYWGKELKQAISDSGVAQGEVISLRCLGQQPVTVSSPVRNEQGHITHHEKIDTVRNQWEVQPAIDRSLLVARNEQATPPSGLSVYDAGQFRALQQVLLEKAGLPPQPQPTGDAPLLWLTPDGKGATPPAVHPENVTVPEPARSAGSVIMRAADDNGQPQLLLARAHGQGDWLQGVVRQGEEWLNVLGKICHNRDGSPYLALNSVAPDGRLTPLGYGTAVNQVRGGEVNFDTFAFALKDNRKIIAPLANPEKIPPRLHTMLGFTQAYAPPQTNEPEKPKAEHRPQAMPGMQPG